MGKLSRTGSCGADLAIVFRRCRRLIAGTEEPEAPFGEGKKNADGGAAARFTQQLNWARGGSSTMRCTMKRPRPVPDFLRVK